MVIRQLSRCGYRVRRSSVARPANTLVSGNGGVSRMRSLGLGLMLALGLTVTGFYASTAQAAGPSVTATFSCSSVTYTFTGFPNAPNNTVSEIIKVNGVKVYKGMFTFNGPSGSNTVKISAPAGHDKILADAQWNTNGVKGEKDIQAQGGIICPEPEPGFSIEKLQEIEGSGEGFTTSELNAVEGQTVDYEIIVTNTGGVPLTFSAFSDENCENVKPGSSSLAPGESTTYTCDHVLTSADCSVGTYANEASVTGDEGTGTETSNKVGVKVE